MSEINKVGINLTHKIANPFKTSRSMSTPNPFKYSNFEGNTLPFADVFEGFENKSNGNGKLKIVSASVAGSMNKIKSLLPESIVNFVNRVREGFSSAMNKELFTIPGEKAVRDIMNADVVDLGKGLSDSIVGLGRGISDKMSILNTDIVDIGKGISDRMSFLNADVTDIGKGLADKWYSLISNVNHNRISKDTPVAELKSMWLDEIALSTKEVA